MNKWLRLAISAAVSLGILVLLFRETARPAQEVARALWTVGLATWAGYALAQLGQGWLRAVRYRLLLQGAGVQPLPGRARMFGVTLARNMFVDLLPARAGELMYWVLLNRSEGVDNEDCASSMALSLWFDFLALVAVLGCAVGIPMLGAQGRLLLAWGMLVVAGVVVVGGILVFRGPAWAVRALAFLPSGMQRHPSVARLKGFVERLAESCGRVRRSGRLGVAAALSVGIRAVKYAGLIVLFYGMAQVLRPSLAELPFWQVLAGLIGGEGGAALPVPTFLSMGTYEAAGSGVLGMTGADAKEAAMVMLGTHVASQVVDYALGGLGLLGLLWGRRNLRTEPARAEPEAGRTNPVLLTGTTLFFLTVVAIGTWTWRAQLKAGAKAAPGAGDVLPMGRHEMMALDNAWGDDGGFIVWSSTMYGNHELVRLDWPSGRMSRLTHDPHVDRCPKISPDGRKVVFARSREEWVSFRNPENWDVWLLDMENQKQRLLAEWAADPSWTADGKGIVFQRGSKEVIRLDLETGAETVLLPAREGVQWETPSLDPDGKVVAVTVRGKHRATALIPVDGGKEKKVAGGCQLAFVPGGEWLVLVEEGGRMKNRICRADRDGNHVETLLDMPGFWSHEYFPRVSNDGTLLVFGAAREGHEHDTADYEIFLWHIGDPPEDAARVSFHTGNDQWPDVWSGRVK